MKKVILLLFLLSIALAVFISPFASTSPDGLERVAEDKEFLHNAEGQEKISAPLPDYSVPGIGGEGLSTSLAGLIGTIITFVIAGGIAFVLKKKEKNTKNLKV